METHSSRLSQEIAAPLDGVNPSHYLIFYQQRERKMMPKAPSYVTKKELSQSIKLLRAEIKKMFKVEKEDKHKEKMKKKKKK